MKEFVIKILKLFFPGLFKEKDEQENLPVEKEIVYKQRRFLSNQEKEFYNKLKKIENYGNYKVHPQLNLATIVDKISDYKYRTELYRNIDFAIFDNEYNHLFLLIELNDSTHNSKSRIDRDLKVEKICNDANIKLIKFYTKYPNEEKYIIDRILKEIGTKND